MLKNISVKTFKKIGLKKLYLPRTFFFYLIARALIGRFDFRIFEKNLPGKSASGCGWCFAVAVCGSTAKPLPIPTPEYESVRPFLYFDHFNIFDIFGTSTNRRYFDRNLTSTSTSRRIRSPQKVEVREPK